MSASTTSTTISTENVPSFDNDGNFVWSSLAFYFVLFPLLCCAVLYWMYYYRWKMVHFQNIVNKKDLRSTTALSPKAAKIPLNYIIGGFVLFILAITVTGIVKSCRFFLLSSLYEKQTCIVDKVVTERCDKNQPAACSTPRCCGEVFYFYKPQHSSTQCNDEYVGKTSQVIYWNCGDTDCSRYYEPVDGSLGIGSSRDCYVNEQADCHYLSAEHSMVSAAASVTFIVLFLAAAFFMLRGCRITAKTLEQLTNWRRIIDADAGLHVTENWNRKYCPDVQLGHGVKELIASYADITSTLPVPHTSIRIPTTPPSGELEFTAVNNGEENV